MISTSNSTPIWAGWSWRLLVAAGTLALIAATTDAEPAGPTANQSAAATQTRLTAALGRVPTAALAVVLVDARLDALLAGEISAYVEAAQRRRKFPIARVAVEGLDDAWPADLRKALTDLKQTHPKLEGVLLVGNVKLPSFFMPRPDVPSVRLWPRYYEDLDMLAERRIAPGTVLHQPTAGQPGPFVAGRKELRVPDHDFDAFVPGRSPGPELWAAFLPVGYADAERNTYRHWADQLRPFFAKAMAFYTGKTQYGNQFYLVSNDNSLLARSAAVYRAVGPAGMEFYAINEKGPGAFKGNPAGYLKAPLEKYPSLDAFLAYAGKLPWMDEGWQSPQIFLEHMRSGRRRIVWWNVHSGPEVSLIRSTAAATMEGGGLIALLNGCGVGGFVQPGSTSFVDVATPAERNMLCCLVYGRSAFLAASGSVHNRVTDEHGQALLPALYAGACLGQAHAAQLRHQDASAGNAEQMRQFQEMLVGDPFVDVQ